MSGVTYNDLWRTTAFRVLELLKREVPSDAGQTEGAEGGGKRKSKGLGIGKKGHPEEVHMHQGQLYAEYVEAYAALEECYDQMAHPQKRQSVKRLLDAVMGRMLELRLWLADFQTATHPNVDRVLMSLDKVAEDLEPCVPHYFVNDRRELLERRAEMLDALIEQRKLRAAARARGPGDETGTDSPVPDNDTPTMDLAEAVAIIQRNERARMGRRRAHQLRQVKAAERKALDWRIEESAVDIELASNLVARVAKGFLVRRSVEEMRRDELRLIGMEPLSRAPEVHEAFVARDDAREHRRLVQAEHAAEHAESIAATKRSIYELEGPHMKDRMEDEIRRWYKAHFRQTGKFPDFPSYKEGGSARIFVEPPPVVAPPDTTATNRRRGVGRPSYSARRGEDSDEDKIEIPASAFIRTIQEGASDFLETWKDIDESDNFDQRHDAGLVAARVRPEVSREIREQVDEVMRMELQNLKIAAKMDKKQRRRRPKSPNRRPGTTRRVPNLPTRRPGGGGGGGGGGGAGRRRRRDPTADISVEQLYSELVHYGIVKKIPADLHVADFKGGYTALAPEMLEAKIEPDPSLGDIRRSVVERVCLPLGSEQLAAQGLGLKTLLLCGPAGSGKTHLAHAIANDTGANVFDLSPANTAGKYRGKKKTLMLHMVFKVAKLMAPSVIIIEDAERVFMTKKKLPRGERGPEGPRRIRKALLKQTKGLKASDRVLVVGTSRRPFDASFRSFTRYFSTVFHVPPPDHSARRVLWEHFVSHAIGPDQLHGFDYTTLTEITEGYTAGQIKDVLGVVVQSRALLHLDTRPLRVGDFTGPLARVEPVFAEEDAAFRKWLAKLPIARAKAARQQAEAEAREAAARRRRLRRR